MLHEGDDETPSYMKDIAKLDIATKQQLGLLYNKCYEENKESICNEYSHLWETPRLVKYNGEYFETDIHEDIKEFNDVSVNVFINHMEMVTQSYRDYTQTVAETEMNRVKHIIQKGWIRKSKVPISAMISFVENYCSDNDCNDLIKKYELIINISIFESGKFDEDLFKKVVYSRLWNLSKDNYTVQGEYLVGTLDRDEDYPQKCKDIRRMVDASRIGYSSMNNMVDDLAQSILKL